jgi:hypothetical protein
MITLTIIITTAAAADVVWILYSLIMGFNINLRIINLFGVPFSKKVITWLF